jgi:hypothetical protein
MYVDGKTFAWLNFTLVNIVSLPNMPFIDYTQDYEFDEPTESAGGYNVEGDGAWTSGTRVETEIDGRTLTIFASETRGLDGSSVFMQTVWENGSVGATVVQIANDQGIYTYSSTGGDPVQYVGVVSPEVTN